MGESTSQGLITSCASRSTLYAPLGWWLRNSCGGNGASSDSLPHRSHSTVEKDVRFASNRLVLHSSKAVHKTATESTTRTKRPPPDPGLGPPVELLGGQLPRALDLRGSGDGLPGKGLPAEEPPPALSHLQPARPLGDEHPMDPRVTGQPVPNRGALVAGEVVADQGELPDRIVLLDRPEQPQGAGGVPGGSRQGDLLAIPHPERRVPSG